MWLSWPAFILMVFAIIGGIVGGGMFTLILVPIAAIALVGLFVAWLLGLTTGHSDVSTTSKPVAGRASSLPRTRGNSGSHAPTSPDRLADQRREQQ